MILGRFWRHNLLNMIKTWQQLYYNIHEVGELGLPLSHIKAGLRREEQYHKMEWYVETNPRWVESG